MEIGQKEREYLKRSIEATGYTAEDTVVDGFIRFYELLIEKNKVMNLTSITEPDEVIIKHYLDSLSIIKAVDFSLNKYFLNAISKNVKNDT